MGKAWGSLVLGVLLLTGCGIGTDTDVAGDAELPPQDPQFLAEDAQWRAERREGLLTPDGWTSLIGLHWIELKAHYVGSGATNGIRLALGPEKLAMLQQESGRVFLTPEKGVPMTLADAPVKSRFELHPDTSPTPGIVVFDDGKGQLSLVQRGTRKALRVKHADAPSRIGFGTLDYWPANEAWRIEADFIPHPSGRTIEIMDITSLLQPLPNPGVVQFERDGKAYALEALEGEDGGLFLVFADRTSGHDTYGAGRYLYTSAPDASGKVVVDFNRAFNPPCAFTDYATCPLPPPDNRLDLAVLAGEKKYVKP